MNRQRIIGILAMLALGTTAAAADWPSLHEQADALTLIEAQTVFQQTDTFDSVYIYGLKCLYAHDYPALEQVIARLQQRDAGRKETRWLEAEMFRRRHEYRASEELLDRILSEDSGFAPAAISLAYIRYAQKRYRECLRLVEQVVHLGRERVDLSNYVRALALVGGAKGGLADQGGPVAKLRYGTQVKSYLSEAQQLQPDSLAVLIGMGSFYVMAPPLIGGDLDEGIEYLRRAIAEDPRAAVAYARLAQAYHKKGDQAAFRSYLEKALEIDSQDEIALELQTRAGKPSRRQGTRE